MTNAEIINQNSFLRLKTKNVRRAALRRIFYILITAVLCTLFAVICAALFFKIQTIEVAGNSIYDSDKLIAISGIKTGQNLYSVSSSKVTANIKGACTYVSSVKVRRRLPSTLVIEVQEDTAAYYIKLAGEYYTLSPDLRVLGRSDSADELIALNPGIKYIAVPELSYCVVSGTLKFRRGLNFKFAQNLMTDIRLCRLYRFFRQIFHSDNLRRRKVQNYARRQRKHSD